MSYPVYYVPSGDVLPIMFDTFDGGTGASVTMSGLAVTDIEIYKDGGTTQRASDAGYTLLDTDGIDFDTITGIHGFSIDTGDNTDAGFYTVGAWFHVVVSAITVDAQTVNFIAAAFRLMPAEGVAGKPKVDVDTFGGTAGTFSGGRPEVNTTHVGGTAQTANDNGADINAILVDTNELQTDWANGGRLDLILDARASQTSVDTVDTNVDSILADTGTDGVVVAAASKTGYSISGTKTTLDALNDVSAAEVNAEVDTAISDAALATAASLATVDAIVDDLKSGIIYGAAATGTLSTTQATTNLTGYADDQLIGRVIIWLSGACEGEATDITDYANASGLITFTALTTAPANGDLFKVV